jgi:hypothetical protein
MAPLESVTTNYYGVSNFAGFGFGAEIYAVRHEGRENPVKLALSLPEQVTGRVSRYISAHLRPKYVLCRVGSLKMTPAWEEEIIYCRGYV